MLLSGRWLALAVALTGLGPLFGGCTDERDKSQGPRSAQNRRSDIDSSADLIAASQRTTTSRYYRVEFEADTAEGQVIVVGDVDTTSRMIGGYVKTGVDTPTELVATPEATYMAAPVSAPGPRRYWRLPAGQGGGSLFDIEFEVSSTLRLIDESTLETSPRVGGTSVRAAVGAQLADAAEAQFGQRPARVEGSIDAQRRLTRMRVLTKDGSPLVSVTFTILESRPSITVPEPSMVDNLGA